MSEYIRKFTNLKCKTCRVTYFVEALFSVNGSEEARAGRWQRNRFCFRCCTYYAGMEIRRGIGRDVVRTGNCTKCNEQIFAAKKFNPSETFSSILIADDNTGDKYYFMGTDAMAHFNNRVCAKHKNSSFNLKSLFKPKRDQSKKARREILLRQIEKHLDEFNSTMAEIEASPHLLLVGDFLPLTALTEITRLQPPRCEKSFRGKKARGGTSPHISSDHPLEGIGNSE